jgi:hypothetical protein
MRFPIHFIAAIASALLAGCQRPDLEEESRSPRGFALPDGGDAARGKEAFVALRCTSCHEVAGLEGELPRTTANPETDVKLGGLAMREPADGELLTSIVNPSHQIYPAAEEDRITSDEGSRMANLNEVMTVQQLLDLVTFLHERYETKPE